MQAMGNTYYAYTHLNDFQGWIELFGLSEEDLIYQKRVLSIVSGAILPIVALGFIKSLVDYIKPSDDTGIKASAKEVKEEEIDTEVIQIVDKEEVISDPIIDANQSFSTDSSPEVIESLNMGRYETSVNVDPVKIN